MSVSDIVEMLKTVIILSLPVVEYLGFKKFNDSYMEEKGKNLATKEDVQELTVLAEDIKIMYQSKQYRDEHIYDIKLSAIQESLEFLDDYLSWLNYNSDIKPVRNDITSKELTLKARKCYNNLVLTCESKELPETFLKLVFKDDDKTLILYNSNFAHKF